jgi:hypothetical protein
MYLLCLERMRMLDTMNRLAEGSMRTYKSPIHRLQRFERTYGVSILRPSPLVKPSTSACIPLMWAQLDHTLQPGKEVGSTVKFSTARASRSAASAYYQWDLAMSRPEQAMCAGRGDKSWVTPHVLPTDEMAYTQFSIGLKRRMGDVATKSYAIRYPHVAFLDSRFELQFLLATTPVQQHEAATAGTANLLFWLGWFRSREGFSLTRSDVTLTSPLDGPLRGLPPGVGVVELRLLPETKTNSSRVADVIIAHTCWTGLSLGKWLTRRFAFPGDHVLSSPAQPEWNSQYYRSKHVWPNLELLRAQGDPSTAHFTDAEGHRVCDKIYSMHSYRRGANTFVDHYQPAIQHRKATLAEIYEHARWARTGTGEEMHIHYREWELDQRLCLTQLCM